MDFNEFLKTLNPCDPKSFQKAVMCKILTHPYMKIKEIDSQTELNPNKLITTINGVTYGFIN